MKQTRRYERFNKLWMALAALALYIVAQLLGVDLGEVGADIDGDTVVQGILAALLVLFGPANKEV